MDSSSGLSEYIIGMDEVGRGALAGPVLVGVAAVTGSQTKKLQGQLEKLLGRGLTDSKHLSRLQREKAYAYLQDSVRWGTGQAEAMEIDSLGLSQALKLAAARALDSLGLDHARIGRIDSDAGLFHPYEKEITTARFIRGDETIAHISYASILAKVFRDSLMREKALRHPVYAWETNVGYGTADHCKAIQTHGLCPEHRRSFTIKLAPAD